MKHVILFASVVLSAVTVFAEATIKNVEVRQLWPWSGDVEIAFTVSGEDTGVKFTAEYEGEKPFVIPENQLSCDFSDLKTGERHVRWNLKKAGLDAKTLFNLKITVEPEDKTYLILNLNDGSYRYAASEPEGGWLLDPANYQTNIVFRRVQKGKKSLGLTDALFQKVGGYYKYEAEHRATLTSDYYISVYMITKGQQEYINAKSVGETLKNFTKPRVFGKSTYDELRGSTNDIDRINWPHTKHDVAYGTVISNVREIVKNTFHSEWIVDIPSNVQWEFAAKGDTSFDQLWSVGGKADDGNFYENCTNLLDQIAIWSHNYVSGSDLIVGQKAKNGYGLYDIVGLGEEWVADLYKNSPSFYTGTNPYGPDEGTTGHRLIRSEGCKIMNLNHYTTAFASHYKQEGGPFGYRLCINLKSYFEK